MHIKETLFDGIKSIEITTRKIRMVITTQCGPRIAFFGTVEGENLLYWDKNGLSYGKWKLYGGHRVWITRPGADESEDAYMEDNEVCHVKIRENGVRITSPAHYMMKIERGMDIEVVHEDELQVTNFIKNAGCMLYSGGVWSPTCIDPKDGKIFGIPLGDDSLSWDIVKIIIPRKFAGNIVSIDDPQITYNNQYMIVHPKGIVTKRAVYAPQGKIAMTWPKENISFIKHSICKRDGNYPLGGCNIAIFVGKNNFMVEMETFGEEQKILPGETIKNIENWKLLNKTLQFEEHDELVD
ncbi:MAG: hypothetical protein N4A64_10690 [Marinisporobacter sp.]|jgi:hypothetical protein|nr:hypothetical protein [Marinisporobacter sp.]